MKIGVPTEIKTHEYRVGATPAGVRALTRAGHRVLVQDGAGEGSGFSDDEYVAAGAQLVPTGADLWAEAEMIVKVKEPLPLEYPLMRPGQLVFTYLHLAAFPELARNLCEREVTAVAYETVQTADGFLPALAPMSAIAGRLATQEGAKYLEKPFGGRGVLLGGVPGVRRGRVTILGGGTVGENAAIIAMGLGAEVTILDVSPRRMIELELRYGARLSTLYATEENVDACLRDSELIVGAVLVAGDRAPVLVHRRQLADMLPGTVIVDVAVDQGGCVETTRATTHDDPIYLVDGIVHYGVANMPAAVSRSSTLALTAVTLPYALALASRGFDGACEQHPELRPGLNTRGGHITHPAVAHALDLPLEPAA